MNTLEAIKTRGAVRSWTDQTVTDDQVIIGSLALGYAKEMSRSHVELDRRPLSKMAFFEQYGKTNKSG